MQILKLKDDAGTFYSWGVHGKHYYYHTPRGELQAMIKAKIQGQAIKASESMRKRR